MKNIKITILYIYSLIRIFIELKKNIIKSICPNIVYFVFFDKEGTIMDNSILMNFLYMIIQPVIHTIYDFLISVIFYKELKIINEQIKNDFNVINLKNKLYENIFNSFEIFIKELIKYTLQFIKNIE